MKILSVNHTADLYGASRCLERVAGPLVAGGHELIVVIPKSGPLQKALERDGVRVLLHPFLPVIDRSALRTAWAKLKLLVTFPPSVLWLAWIILRHRIDVVHTNSAVVCSPAFAARLTRRPHVWHIREFFLEFPSMWRHYERVIHRMSTVIIAISAAVKNQFSAPLRPKIEVVYDGLPRDEFSAGAVDHAAHAFRSRFQLGGVPLAGVVGRLKWGRKGQEVLIRAAALLRDKYPTAKYVVVGTAAPGNEEHLDRFRALVDELNLRDTVVFTGDIDDVRPVYAALDVSVAPPVDPEPFGCIVIESMAMGTPVIGSNAAGIAEQIVDGETGILFAPGNEHELAQALDRLFRNRALREDMSAKGVRLFREKFDMDRCYQEYLRVFERAAARSNRGISSENKQPESDLAHAESREVGAR
jgi:glycosyltransferase involved in cell wall biosynthesis